ncbi:glucose-6-phosphate isomerase [Xanthobacter agilis]|uniref:Glucose-6-phosphate isomerase n=1 Tax=Xanthobacter agilis TaxID=47492 RepID=A0ABU0LGS2_XANAG|nr:glucose-6-phosphate isomerase [Xanthobacter agilis]MDQ0506341.1 glucose-6-phosphate isomerase [Xanthobacter agilis]
MTATQPLWHLLSTVRAASRRSLRDLNADPHRFAAFSRAQDDLLLDFSKTELCADSLALLLRVAEAAGVGTLRDAMFAGDRINVTENRAVLHVALRDRSATPLMLDGVDVKAEIRTTLAQLSDFATAIRTGHLTGATGRAITDVVNIGIGGSDLGPAMATLALAPYHDGPRCHFVSNVDSAHISDTLKPLDPATTLVIVASKTFTTVETMCNAHTARAWITRALGEDAVSAHFAAVSTARDKIREFGITPERAFGFWDWVGGRYSLWSAIGLSVMLAIGPARFRELLAGAEAMDLHFRTAPFSENLPVLLALIGLWHRDVCDYSSRAVVPYDQRLARLPAYLQQLDMESNGKGVTRDGLPVAQPTGPIVWGEPGTNAQHAFFQLLHQGTEIVPVEFLIAAEGHEPELKAHHDLLVASCLAQSEALMRGRTLEEAAAQLRAKGLPEAEVAALAPHRVFPGDRPSVTLAYRRLDPYTLGRLIALYEHRVFVEAAVWNINAFDQWGVELGKELATAFLPAVQGEAVPADASGSTRGLLAHLAPRPA